MRARVFLAFLPLLAPLLGAGAAIAQPAQPLDRLLPQIRRDHPGQFLDAEGADAGGNPHYHLKWLTPDGRVMWLDTDARTGRVVNQSPGRDRFDAARPAPDRAGPPDRSNEGRGAAPRYDRPDDSRFGNRQQYRPDQGRPQGNFGGRYERGPGGGNGGGFERRDFSGGGNRNFGGGGGRDRRGGR